MVNRPLRASVACGGSGQEGDENRNNTPTFNIPTIFVLHISSLAQRFPGPNRQASNSQRTLTDDLHKNLRLQLSGTPYFPLQPPAQLSGTPYFSPQLSLNRSENWLCHEQIAPSQTIRSTRSSPEHGIVCPCLQPKLQTNLSSESLEELSEIVRLSSATLWT